jgi:mannitol-1-phosphate/altronate dehydrogenase
MKLRPLNGSHTFLAIVGSLMGLQSVSQAVVHPELKPALLTLMHTQKRSLNPKLNIEHLLKQIATDSSQKIPVRLIAPMKNWRIQSLMSCLNWCLLYKQTNPFAKEFW